MKTHTLLSSFVSLSIILAFFIMPVMVSGQAAGDYRSAQDGDWSALDTWEYYDGSTWTTPTGSEGYPGELIGTGFVTIRDGHTIPLNLSPPEPIDGLMVIGDGPGDRSTLQVGMGNQNRTLLTSYVFLGGYGQIYWVANGNLYINEDAVVITQNEGGLFPEDENNAMRLYFGDVWYAASKVPGGGACTFEEVNNAQGDLSELNFNLTSNSPIYVGQALTLEVEIDDEDVIDEYSWSGVGPGGYTFGPEETTTPEQDVDDITIPGTYTFTVIVELGCGFGLDEIEVIVEEAPPVDCSEVNIGPFCLDADPVTLTGATPDGGAYSGSGVSPSNGGFIFDPSVAGADDHIIIYTLGSNSCTFTITVNALPEVLCTDLDDEVCIDDAAFALTGATPGGGTYSGTGVSGADFDPSVAGIGTHDITYSYTDGNGCTNSCTFTITVVEPAMLDCPDENLEVNVDAQPFSLNVVTPGGGVYDGPGVTNNVFNPASVGVGSYSITYTYENACISSCTFTINVVEEIYIQLGLNLFVIGDGDVDIQFNGPGPYQVGDVVTLTATPAPGWDFIDWKYSMSPITITLTNPLVFTLTGSPVITATFYFEPLAVPLSNWSLIIGIFAILAFVVIRFRHVI